jgi:hypothetical protein
VQSVLARAYLRWAKVSASERVEPYVKKMIVNEHLGGSPGPDDPRDPPWRRRRASRETLTAPLEEGRHGRR